MFLRRKTLSLSPKHLHCFYEFDSGLSGLDDLINQAEFRGDIRIVEFVFVVIDQFDLAAVGVVGAGYLSSMDDVDSFLELIVETIANALKANIGLLLLKDEEEEFL